MNVTARLTLDGMIRALRWRAHALAEDIEHGYRDETREEGDRRAHSLPRLSRLQKDEDDRVGE